MVAAYGAGATIRQLAVRTGRGYGTVHRVLREAGVAIRAQGNPAVFSDAQALDLVAAYRQGDPVSTLMARYRISAKRVRALLTAAGVEIRRRRRAWTPEQAAAIVAAYQAGASTRDVAAHCECGRTTVERVLREAGVTLRRGEFEPRPLTSEQLQDLVAGYRDGASMDELARRYRIANTRVRALLLDAGVELRPHGGHRRRAR